MIPIHRTAYAYALPTQDKPRRERGIFSNFVIGRRTGLRRRRGFDDWTGERSRDTDARAAKRAPFGSSGGRVRGRRVSPTRGLPSGVAHASRLHSCLRGAIRMQAGRLRYKVKDCRAGARRSWGPSAARLRVPVRTRESARQEKSGRQKNGAGYRVRTGDIQLGKLALYQLS